MIEIPFSNGNTHPLKNRWEELSTKEYLEVLDLIALFFSGKLSLPELRQMVFFLLTGLKPKLHNNKEKADRQAENIYRIAQQITFMLRIDYEAQKSFTRLKKEVREQLSRYLPEELEQTPEVRWAAKAKKQFQADLVFCKNLVPTIGRHRHIMRGYSFEVQDHILMTSLTTAQFIDAQTVAGEIHETGKEPLLNLLVAILYCKGKYDPGQARLQAKTLEQLDLRTKKAIFVNFNAIQAFLYTRTKYALLFSESDPATKAKHNLGLGSAVHSLIKAGYGDVENSNLVKFFELMYTELVTSITSLHKQGIPIDKIADQTGLSINKINQIL